MGLALIVEKEKIVYGPGQTLIQAEFLILHYLRLLKRTVIMPNSTMSMTTLTLHGTQTQSQSPLHRIMRFTMMILLLMEKDMIQAMTLVIWCNLIVIIMVCIILRLT